MKLKLDGGLSQNEANRRDREGGGGVKKCAEEKGGVAYGTITRALRFSDRCWWSHVLINKKQFNYLEANGTNTGASNILYHIEVPSKMVSFLKFAGNRQRR